MTAFGLLLLLLVAGLILWFFPGIDPTIRKLVYVVLIVLVVLFLISVLLSFGVFSGGPRVYED